MTQQSGVGLPQARRALGKYRELLHAIPGCNRMGIRPVGDEKYAIEIGFDSSEAIDAAIKEGRVSPNLDGVPVVVESTPGIVRLAVDPPWYRPAKGGCEVSHSNDQVSGGTLGAWVRDKLTGRMCVISCEHVLDVIHNPNAWVVQPRIANQGSPEDDRIAKNLRGYYDEYHDCAIAEVISDAQLSTYGLGYTSVMAAAVQMSSDGSNGWCGQRGAPYVGERVVKYGIATGFTEGEIDRLDQTISMEGGGVLRDVIRVKNVGDPEFEFARKGDSGSLMLQKGSSNARGLVTAIINKIGEPFTWYTYVQKWDRVARKLQLDLGRYRLQPEELNI